MDWQPPNASSLQPLQVTAAYFENCQPIWGSQGVFFLQCSLHLLLLNGFQDEQALMYSHHHAGDQSYGSTYCTWQLWPTVVEAGTNFADQLAESICLAPQPT